MSIEELQTWDDKYTLGALRKDKMHEKRVELHAHTSMSAMDSLIPPDVLVRTAANWGWEAVAITDHCSVQAFPSVMKTVKRANLNIKIIYGMEGYLTEEDYKQSIANHIVLLVKNKQGLENLYKLVSLSYLKFFHNEPRIPRQVLEKYRDGLLVGSACATGELISAIVSNKSDDELLSITEFYDYLEIQPIEIYKTSICRDMLLHFDNYDEGLRDINRKIVSLARISGKSIVATGNAHILNPEDAACRFDILEDNGIMTNNSASLFLRTTEEMLSEFNYLGEEIAHEVVVENPRKLAKQVETVSPLPDKRCWPVVPNVSEMIENISYSEAYRQYGNPLPKIVQNHLDKELDIIKKEGYATYFHIAYGIAKKALADGHFISFRGNIGTSFVANLIGITDVNPLPPHRYCTKCMYNEFMLDGSCDSGFDLPVKKCPRCGETLINDGHDISYAVFFDVNGGKTPRFDLDFSFPYSEKIKKYATHILDVCKGYECGQISKCNTWIDDGDNTVYFSLKKGLSRSVTVIYFTPNIDYLPLQYTDDDSLIPSNDVNTHFDYKEFNDNFLKINILSHSSVKLLETLAGNIKLNYHNIPFDDCKTLSLFSSNDLHDIYEFHTETDLKILSVIQPKTFSGLVKAYGFSHGSDVWDNNAQDLISNGTCSVSDAIATREDVMTYLMRKGMDYSISYEIMESVRKGKGINENMEGKLHLQGVPYWYVKSCKKIRYLCSRAYATECAIRAYSLAYYKVHYPIEFKQAFSSVYPDEHGSGVN